MANPKKITGAADSSVPASRSGATVTVASKLPMSFEMQCCKKMQQHVKNGNNSWTEDVYVKDGDIVVIAGTAYPNGQVPEGMPERPTMAFGCALTSGVNKDFFDRWLEQNKDAPMVKNRLIFAHEEIASVKSMARENQKALSGLDALNPAGDRRMPKKLKGKVGSVTVGEEADREPAEAD